VRGLAWAVLMTGVLVTLAPRPAEAQSKFSSPALAPVTPPAPVLEADLEEHLGRRLDPTLAFTGADGRRVVLGDLVSAGKPTVLVLAYYRCPMLCGLVLSGVVEGLRHLDWRLGHEYRALTVSFDPRDTPAAAAQKQASTLAGLGRPLPSPGDWPFLVGQPPAVEALADAVGFRYAYDARTDQYAHPAAAVVLTPDGRVSRYLYGVSFSARDLRLALLEAGDGKIGTIVDRLLFTCYRYDPASRAYGPFIVGFMRIGGALILLTVAAMLLVLVRADRRRDRERAS
jgi:protein SCO1/2